MPIYAYRCSSCGYEQDVLQKISAAPLTDCPSCGKPDFHKQLSAPTFQLKGTGWYVTDFRDNGTKPAGQDAKPGKSLGSGDSGKGASSGATDGGSSAGTTASSGAASGGAGAASGSD